MGCDDGQCSRCRASHTRSVEIAGVTGFHVKVEFHAGRQLVPVQPPGVIDQQQAVTGVLFVQPHPPLGRLGSVDLTDDQVNTGQSEVITCGHFKLHGCPGSGLDVARRLDDFDLGQPVDQSAKFESFRTLGGQAVAVDQRQVPVGDSRCRHGEGRPKCATVVGDRNRQRWGGHLETGSPGGSAG